jgi:hypothetical protein
VSPARRSADRTETPWPSATGPSELPALSASQSSLFGVVKLVAELATCLVELEELAFDRPGVVFT